MGCHTWFYKRVQRTEEEARRIWIEHQKQSIENWLEIVNNPQDECRVAYEWSQEYCESYLDVLKRQLRMVEDGLCSSAIWNKQPDDEDKLYRYLPGKGLFATNDDLPHDIFRIHNYPEDRLFSFEETLNFLDEHNILLTQEQILRLKKFWNQNPDGMISFG